MISISKPILRCIRMQRFNYKHLYLLAIIWIVLLYGGNNHAGDISEESSGRYRLGGPQGGVMYPDITPPERKLSQAETYRSLQDVRDNLLKDYIGKDLPPWLDPEVNDSQPTLGDILESRQVRRVVISTTWRSGSTFLGDLLAAYPGAFYHFEPFHFISEKESITRSLESQATGLLYTLLTCRYDVRTQPYLQYITSGRYHFLLEKNPRMMTLCRHGRAFCLQGNVVATACAMHPLNFAKTVRLRLSGLRPLLQDSSLDLKVIHLVRDPRGVANSRSRMPWCKGQTCRDLSAMCHAANQDAQTAKEYSVMFPKNFLVVRYEDLVLQPFKSTRKIFEFLNLPLVSELAVYIEEHTNTRATLREDGETYTYAALFSTYRNSTATATSWRKHLSFAKTRHIQDLCYPALRYYGYKRFHSQEELSNADVPVFEAPLGTNLEKQPE